MIDTVYDEHKDFIDLNSRIFDVLIQFNLTELRDKKKSFMDEVYKLIVQLDSDVQAAK